MTELAYLPSMDAAYVQEFRARVVSLPPGAAVLDRTLFYPTGGGQPHDEGTLTGPDGVVYQVVDVTKSGSSVVHRLAKGAAGALRVGDEATGRIDWGRRHRFMRFHSAQHLVSALAFRETGLRTHRAELRADWATVDLEGRWPASPSFESFTNVVSTAVRAVNPLEIRYVPRAEWDKAPTGRSGLVPLPPSVDPVRIVEIHDLDECPCGGTHVRSIAEVGAIEFEGPPLPRDSGCRIRFRISEGVPPTSSA